jgi:hypothetical protein
VEDRIKLGLAALRHGLSSVPNAPTVEARESEDIATLILPSFEPGTERDIVIEVDGMEATICFGGWHTHEQLDCSNPNLTEYINVVCEFVREILSDDRVVVRQYRGRRCLGASAFRITEGDLTSRCVLFGTSDDEGQEPVRTVMMSWSGRYDRNVQQADRMNTPEE